MAPLSDRLLARRVFGVVLGDGRGRRVALASALLVGHQAGELAVPVVAGLVIDRAVLTGDLAALGRWLVVLAVVFAILSNSYRWGDRIVTRAMEDAALELRRRLSRRILDDRGLAGHPTGELVSIASSDVGGASEVTWAVAMTVGAVAAMACCAAVLVAISLPLGAIALLGLPPVLFVTQRLMAPIERRAAERQEEVGRAALAATDLVAGLRVLKGLHAEDAATARYRVASRRSLVGGLRASRVIAVGRGANVAATGAFVAAIALVGSRLAAEGTITVGELAAAVGVTQFLIGPLGRIGFAARIWAMARASAARVGEVLDADPLVTGGDRPVTMAGPLSVSFDGVHAGSLHGLDLEVAAGRFVAVACESGGDADALVELLARWRDLDDGALCLEGVPIHELDIGEVRRVLHVAAHDAPLFGGSALGNVTAGAAPGVDVDAAVATAAADEVFGALPDGGATEVLEQGAALSGGQRQRLALARALAVDAPVLVLHEPTTAVDAVTEAHIAASLRSLRAGRTTIVVATSPALLASADEVVFIADGQVARVGSHEELLDDAAYRVVVLG